jgi:uncharacterized protein HemX
MGRVMGRRALVAALILALAAGGACGYASSAQDRWTDTRGRSGADGQRRSSYRRNDNPLLDQAMDAFKQAKHLETSLKKSERAVSDQTKELKSELRKAKATARSTGQVKNQPCISAPSPLSTAAIVRVPSSSLLRISPCCALARLPSG